MTRPRTARLRAARLPIVRVLAALCPAPRLPIARLPAPPFPVFPPDGFAAARLPSRPGVAEPARAGVGDLLPAFSGAAGGFAGRAPSDGVLRRAGVGIRPPFRGVPAGRRRGAPRAAP
ncbi:hypothetical protein Misp01_37220 [Microtetraspora sp. NBRC 13810]|nr:hypothetical protein Misp01_37220 [Microtetraspora sp. NBRC 13810]